MVISRKFVLTLIAVCYLCVIACFASPITINWVDDIEVGQIHSAHLDGYSNFYKPADLWFTITYDNTIVELSGLVITEDPDHSRIATVERLAINKVQVKTSDSSGDFGTIADIYFRGVSPGIATVSIDYQRYGYYQGSTYFDRLSNAYSSQDSFKVYKPYAISTAPCRIEAENYDYGPNGFAYYDTTPGNSGCAYRSEDVDISQMPGGGYNIGYVADGEWLEYTVNIPKGYGDWDHPPTINVRAASWKDGCKIEINNEIVDIGNTQNAWRTFTTNLSVWPDETNIIKVDFIGSGQTLDYIEFVKSKPIAAFEISDNQFNTQQTVEFSDNSLFLPTTWEWSFGDGSSSNLQNPSHIYSNPGRYPVTLKVTNNEGSSSLRKFVYFVFPIPSQPSKILSMNNDESLMYGHYKMFGNNILYANQGDLNLYDINTKTSKSIFTSKTPAMFDFNDEWVVWSNSDYDALNQRYLSNVYLFNIQTAQETQLTSSYSASNPSISGNNIVFQDRKNGNYDIYLYNTTTKTQSSICSESHDQTNPVIDGNNVVWEDYRLGHERSTGYDLEDEPISNIYTYSLTTRTGRLLSTIDFDQCAPDISGNRIVWQDQRMGRGESDAGHYYYWYDIYIYDLTTNSESMIKELYTPGNDYGSLSSVKIYSNYITWDHSFTPAVELFDLSTNKEYEIDGGSPEIYKNQLIFSRSADVYLLTLPAQGPSIIPGGSGSPQDLNIDGKYEDVNGNGRTDFADVVLYFNQMSWITENEPISAFDYNNNGRIDFADVVTLFNGL